MKIIQSVAAGLVLLSLAMCAWQPAVTLAQSEEVTEEVAPGFHDSLADWTDPLSKTVIRFFESQSQYLPGDLIVRSQVAELQAYLRKTEGACPATNPQLRRRVLVDHACLARVFYGLGGDRLLREAARKLGSYGPLDRLCQSKAGRAILTTAVRQSNLEMLMDYLQKHELPPEPVRAIPLDQDIDQKQLARKLHKIYTLEELLKSLDLGPAS